MFYLFLILNIFEIDQSIRYLPRSYFWSDNHIWQLSVHVRNGFNMFAI